MIVEHPRSLRLKKIAAHGFLLGFLAVILFPFAMIVSISFREGNFTIGELWPSQPTLEHWALALGFDYTRSDGTVVSPPYPVLLWMWNSVKIGLMAALGVLALATVSAYAFSRLRFAGRGALLDGLFLIQMFPTTLTLVALYAIFDSLGDVAPVVGINSHLSVVLVYMSGIILHVWTLKGYFDGIDSALDKAAAMDGATPWQTFRHVFLPLAMPMMAVIFVLVFIGCVNEYPVASVLIRSEDMLTLATGSRLYLNEFKYLWGDFAAAAILSGLPITCVFLIAQRYLVSGLSEGAVKG
ncbi:maltose ABC transporter permease MalG [Neogemmobacter tilapiae]|uniref:Maltose/maltodextrin transport system permease protein MalG n=1 Tax=Neogemmobacter tilapiae TaxID=875041 RepID=A0A918TVK9_9RHOB|nr:maltose ABC transporter permease MalG [Gemmobacter tilapiae]GHC62104.1 maltose transporter permease [Gemmobacter tilapiae]